MYESDEGLEERQDECDRIDRLEAYADDLYDQIRNREITAGQARGMMERAKAQPRRTGL